MENNQLQIIRTRFCKYKYKPYLCAAFDPVRVMGN